jgi:hypothetical protein
MSLLSWLRSRASLRSPRARAHHRPAAPSFRPQLEALEDRWLPSTLTVTNNLDSGPGCLRAEIAAAQSGDTIVFANKLKGQTITLAQPANYNAELYIDKNLNIEGLGARYLAISGGNQSRVFEVAPNVQVTLSGMTIENGKAYLGNVAWGGGSYDQGGGILNFGTLTLSGCTVTGNYASQGGGGIANELGGTMTISGSTVSRNTTNFLGGADGWGGGIYNDGHMTLSGSTVIHNSSDGIFNGSDGVLTILSSTVKTNQPNDLYNVGTYSVDSNSTIG